MSILFKFPDNVIFCFHVFISIFLFTFLIKNQKSINSIIILKNSRNALENSLFVNCFPNFVMYPIIFFNDQ